MKNDDHKKNTNFLRENLVNIHHRIDKACENSNRNSEDVKLMLVTKTIPVGIIEQAIEQGEKLLGENVSEELENTYQSLHSKYQPDIHFIGYLRSNELDKVITYSDCIQTVDRVDIARDLNQRMKARNQNMDILIQVNTSRRDSPYGMSPEHSIGNVLKIAKLPNLHIRGLMTLGLFDTTEDKARSCFQLLKNLHDEIKFLRIPGVRMEIISMGMSDHLETAIEEGSTMIRVGTAVFGKRETPDSYYWTE